MGLGREGGATPFPRLVRRPDPKSSAQRSCYPGLQEMRKPICVKPQGHAARAPVGCAVRPPDWSALPMRVQMDACRFNLEEDKPFLVCLLIASRQRLGGVRRHAVHT